MRTTLLLFILLVQGILISQEKNPFDISSSDELEVLNEAAPPNINLDSVNANPFNIIYDNGSMDIADQKVKRELLKNRNNQDGLSNERHSSLTLIVSIISLILTLIGINNDRIRFGRIFRSLVNTNANNCKEIIFLKDFYDLL